MTAARNADRIERADQELLRIVDSAFADAAERSGAHLLCRAGCTQCCHGAFGIHALDAARLRRGMAVLREQQPEMAAAIEARAVAYVAEFGGSFPGDAATGILGRSDAEIEAFEEFANDAPCPVLNPETGRCDLYASRPMTCRVFGPPIAVDEGYSVCELCFTTATPEEVSAAAMRVPQEHEADLLAQITQGDRDDETIVAWCLVPSDPASESVAADSAD